MKIPKFFTFLFLIAAASLSLNAQTVYQVSAGDSTLAAAVANAASGDIIELITDGGLYTMDTQEKIVIDKPLTIRAREGLAEKPVLKSSYTGSTSIRYFEIQDGGNLHLKGLEFDGTGADNTSPNMKNAIRNQDISQADSFHTDYLVIEDCDFHDVTEQFIKFHSWTSLDSLLIDNSTFYRSKKEGIVLYVTSSEPGPDITFVGIRNTTFAKTGREALYVKNNDPEIQIENCTFYDCGTSGQFGSGDSKRIIYPYKINEFHATNSIFVKNTYDNFLKLYGNSSLTYSVIWDVDNISTDGTNYVVSDTLRADPLFADAENYNFTLDAASPARTAGPGGTPVGDLRWAIDPNSKLVTVKTIGNGIVQLDPPGGVYAPGTSLKLTAVPDQGWDFVGWDGISVFPPDANPAQITVNDNITVTATFVNSKPQVTLAIDTVGLGWVEASPAPYPTGTYDQGTVVTLTAHPRPDWDFDYWTGDIDSSVTNPIQVTLDSNMTVEAVFASVFTQFSLTINVTGMGEVLVDPKPIVATYDTATVVHLEAVPELGWTFDGFTGDFVSTSAVDSVRMDSNIVIMATFSETQYSSGTLAIDTSWSLYDAVALANNNSIIDTLLLVTSGGVYTSYETGDVAVFAPLTIIGADTLADRPILTNSDPEKSNLDVLRVFDDIRLENLVLDGGHELSHGMKYAVRLSNYTDTDVKTGTNVMFDNVDFINFYQNKDPKADGHALKIDKEVQAGFVDIENCRFANFGYEAIRISDTEKWPTEKAVDSMVVRNCTFRNIDAEGIRYYSDAKPETPDAPVLVEHCTFDSSATRVMYLKNSGGAIVRDIIVSNSRQSGHGRDSDLMDPQGQTGIPSYVSHINLWNTPDVPVKSTDGEVDSLTLYNIDPQYVDASAWDYTLKPTSHLYGLGHDGKAIGDLNWATETPVIVYLDVTIEGNGSVIQDPAPIGASYDPGTTVTITAVADSGYEFVEWTGDVASTDNPTTVTMDADHAVTAKFEKIVGVEDNQIPKEFSLQQNFPNPFNPTTTIKFGLPVAAKVTVSIFNVLGQQVAQLVNGELSEGYHQAIWNGTNDFGMKVTSGIYIYRIDAQGQNNKSFNKTMKMILMK